jgi:hypothetical protein
MFVPFSDLPESARVWVYQANRSLTAADLSTIEDVLTSFISRWQSHGSELYGSFKVLYNRFLILAVDTQHNMPSGCSIDSSVAELREICQALQLDLFDRTQVLFLEEGGAISALPLSGLKAAVEAGKVKEQAITFNNLVDTKEKLESEWLVTAANSWMKRYFTVSAN